MSYNRKITISESERDEILKTYNLIKDTDINLINEAGNWFKTLGISNVGDKQKVNAIKQEIKIAIDNRVNTNTPKYSLLDFRKTKEYINAVNKIKETFSVVRWGKSYNELADGGREKRISDRSAFDFVDEIATYEIGEAKQGKPTAVNNKQQNTQISGQTQLKYYDCPEGPVKPFTYGCRSEKIREIQKALNMQPNLQTGNFGPYTLKAIRLYINNNPNIISLPDFTKTGITEPLYNAITGKSGHQEQKSPPTASQLAQQSQDAQQLAQKQNQPRQKPDYTPPKYIAKPQPNNTPTKNISKI